MPPELAGIAEIAELLGVTKRTAERYVATTTFPAPVDELAGRRRVWRRADVERWGRENLPRPRTGRPRLEP